MRVPLFGSVPDWFFERLRPFLIRGPECVGFGYILRTRAGRDDSEREEAKESHLQGCRRCSLVEHVWKDFCIGLIHTDIGSMVGGIIHLFPAGQDYAQETAGNIHGGLRAARYPDFWSDRGGAESRLRQWGQRLVLEFLYEYDAPHDDEARVSVRSNWNGDFLPVLCFYARECARFQAIVLREFTGEDGDLPADFDSHAESCPRCRFLSSWCQTMHGALRGDDDEAFLRAIARILGWVEEHRSRFPEISRLAEGRLLPARFPDFHDRMAEVFRDY